MKNDSTDSGLSRSVIKKILELMTAAFSLVAALAWNDAIQSLFARVFGEADGIIAKFLYAALVTAIVVVIIMRMSRLAKE